ncbi:hypothetical protein PM082_004297 [Marasmius tenuissimus]|nr:hypothetical protein PM082_004297 [Marasmius tenuissimus]
MDPHRTQHGSAEVGQPSLPFQHHEAVAASPNYSPHQPQASLSQNPSGQHPGSGCFLGYYNPSSSRVTQAEAPTSESPPSTVTENHGQYSRTAVRSNGKFFSLETPRGHSFHFTVHENRHCVQYYGCADPSVPSTLGFSQNHTRSDEQGPFNLAVSTPLPTNSSQMHVSTRRRNGYIPGQRYTSLLSAGCSGYALWKPSPRYTASGKEYVISIGDVGVCHDTDPFHAFFNITKDLGGLSGVRPPNGVDPPCVIEEDDITVDARFHERNKVLAMSEAPISVRTTRVSSDSSVFTLQASTKAGALLMLPQGGILRKLHKTSEFRRRILRHWEDWYKFADEQGEVETPTLCLVTGVEQCSTWAMAVWDATSTSSSHSDPGSLELTVTEFGECSWTSWPVRCTIQSSEPRSPHMIDDGTKETVFIRALWISRSDGKFSDDPPSSSSGSNEGGSSDRDHARPHHSTRGPSDHLPNSTRGSWNLFHWFYNGSSSNSPSLSEPRPFDRSELSSLRISASVLSSPDESPIDTSRFIDLPANSDAAFQPCRSINKLALEIASRAQPSLFNAGCVAFSHDEDWMSVIEDLDEPHVPMEDELLKCICGKFKFVAEGDAIYTEPMTSSELDLIRQSPAVLAQNGSTLIPILFHIRETGASPLHETQEELTGISSKTHSRLDDYRPSENCTADPGDYLLLSQALLVTLN